MYGSWDISSVWAKCLGRTDSKRRDVYTWRKSGRDREECDLDYMGYMALYLVQKPRGHEVRTL